MKIKPSVKRKIRAGVEEHTRRIAKLEERLKQFPKEGAVRSRLIKEITESRRSVENLKFSMKR